MSRSPTVRLGMKSFPGEHPPCEKEPPEQFARDLGLFLARLHGLPPDAVRTATVPEVDPRRRVLNAQPVVAPVLENRLSAEEMARVLQWWEDFAGDPRLLTSRLAVCHHDLWHENLLMSPEGRLTGVLDWSHC